MRKLFVSLTGNKAGDGTERNPFPDIESAVNAARAANEACKIVLRGGTYFLKETLSLDERDSGLSFSAYDNEKPIISGGTRITGWEKLREGIWRAKVKEPNVIRELYVNGRAAKRAAGKTRVTPLGWYNDLSNLKTTVDGIFVKNEDVRDIKYASEVQLHYCRGWKSMVLNVDEIKPYDDEKSVIIIHNPTLMQAIGTLHGIAQSTPFIIENALCFMDSENDFYYDSHEKYLYYRTSGDMTECECIAPRIEVILSVSGSDLNHKVKDISFDGISFCHAAWNLPSVTGAVMGQACTMAAIDSKSHDPFKNGFVGAGIRINAANNVAFKNGEFYGFGANAIGLYDGVHGSDISGNVFYDICCSAITVGFHHHNYEEPKHFGKNLAIGKHSYASEEYRNNEAKRANCGDLHVGWFTDMPDQWWEVDLGENKEFNRIEIVSRLDRDQEDSRSDFSVLAATEEEPDKYDVLFKAGSEQVFDFRATLTIDFDVKKYRYVRVKRDIQHYFFINEVRVIDTREEFLPYKEICTNNIVQNNVMTRCGLYSWCSPAITAYYTKNLSVIHNTIFDVPYSGISIGWGWSMYTDSDTCRNNFVLYNEVYDHMRICFDGGAVYTLGNQPGSVIRGNYFHDQPNFPGVIYMDEGTEGYTITENVVENGDVSFFIHLPTSRYIKAYKNYVTSPSYSNQGEKCEIKDTICFIPGFYSDEIKDIISCAGVTDKSLFDKIPHYEKSDERDCFFNMITEKEHVTEAVFVTQYLKKCIYELENIIKLAKNEDEITEIQTDELKKLLCESKNFLEKPHECREEIIDFRLYMKKKTKEILKK